MPREDVDRDAKRLAEEFPELGKDYRIESSKSGGEHFHVIFLKSQFTKFEDAYKIALRSKADRDWLALCKVYECFGLETEGARRYNQVRQQREKQRVVNKPVKMITSPYILDLVPATALDARRIIKLCEAINDPTWQFTSFIHVWELQTHIQIGCINEAQACRRMAWLTENGLQFSGKIKRNK